jgi:hypothetical protein
MPLFRVQLAELRWLTAYIDAKDSDAAIRRTRATWFKLKHPAVLPFELRAAKLMPAASAARIKLPTRKSKRSRRTRG